MRINTAFGGGRVETEVLDPINLTVGPIFPQQAGYGDVHKLTDGRFYQLKWSFLAGETVWVEVQNDL